MRALSIARITLLIFAIIYVAALGLSLLRIGNPLAGIGFYSAIGIGISAFACAAIQVAEIIQRRQR